jgi:predicted transcriptional regulator
LAKEAINIPVKEPRYRGSWKGRVIKAIVIDGAKKWEDIREFTGLSQNSLKRALAELFALNILEKRNHDYFVCSPEIGEEYRVFFAKEEEKVVRFPQKKQRDLVKWIDQWRELMELDFSLESKHFYLEGRHLDQLSQALICRAESEVLVVNPFVAQCDLSDTLRSACQRGVDVKLITRPPDDKRRRYQREKREYHLNLSREGVALTYNKKAHAKLIVVDRTVGIASSMNFYSGSSGGSSWEAGLVSVEENVVENMANSILNFIERPETTEIT